jgi:hypothetical protein
MVQPKYSPEEALERVKLMMKYDTSKTLSEQQTTLNLNTPRVGGVPVIKPRVGGPYKEPPIQPGLPAWVNDYPCLLKNNLGTPIRTDREEVQINVSNNDYIVFSKEKKCVYVFGNGTMVNGSWSCKDGKLYIKYDDGKEYDDSKQPSKSAPNTTQKPAPNTTQKPASNSSQLPPELKDVKDFQDWLDINAKEWATGYKDGKLSQGAKNPGFKSGGYGKFGPRTQKAWSTYKDQYLKDKGIKGAGDVTTTNQNLTGYEDYKTDEVETSVESTQANDDKVEQ